MRSPDRLRGVLGRAATVGGLALLASACGGEGASDGPAPEASPTGDVPASEASRAAEGAARTALVELWSEGVPAFGVFAPSERAPSPDGGRPVAVYTEEIGRELAANELLDYVFLNLEPSFDADAVAAIASGLDDSGATGETTLLVRIPPISADGPDAARERVAASLAAGADGIVFPHVRSPDEARMVVGFMEEAGADVWSPSNPDGSIIAMVMIEDPGALADVAEIADVEGYSVLACGIGSLTRALGDRAAGEAGNQEVLEHATRVGRPDMITADADDVERRLDEGFLGLLMNGPEADEAIRVGRAASGR